MIVLCTESLEDAEEVQCPQAKVTLKMHGSDILSIDIMYYSDLLLFVAALYTAKVFIL